MNLEHEILSSHSKEMCARVVKWVGQSQERFDELFRLFTGQNPILIQRSGWPMSYAVEAHPHLIKKHFARLMKNLQRKDIHESARRNTVRLLQAVDIPEKFQGQVMDTCFAIIGDPAEKPATKAFSLTVLDNLSKLYTDIRPEIKAIIEERWDYETAAFHSRARKILKKMPRSSA